MPDTDTHNDDHEYKLHFRLSDASTFSWPGLTASSYSEESDFERASAARFFVTSHHGAVKSTRSDRIYLVLNGSGWFNVKGNRFEVFKDDVVIVPRDTGYDYGGEDLELFLVHSPAYKREAEVQLDAPD